MKTVYLQLVAFLALIFRYLPKKFAFSSLVLSNLLCLPGKSILHKAFTPAAAALLRQPSYRFSNGVSRHFFNSELAALNGIGAHIELTEIIERNSEKLKKADSTILAAASYFECGNFEKARELLRYKLSPARVLTQPRATYLLAQLDLICGDMSAAILNAKSAAKLKPSILRPHHNLAARFPNAYVPNDTDLASGDLGIAYDLANYVGQRVTHVGRGDLCTTIYSAATVAQKQLNSQVAPPLSAELASLLQKLGVSFEDIRIFPEEWSSQIGHIGMLDIMFRMRSLGWWSGTAIVSTRSNAVANKPLLDLFANEGILLLEDGDMNAQIASELASLQRWKGLSFNAFEFSNGDIVPWQEAGALAMRQWELHLGGYPIRDRYDEVYGSSDAWNENVARLKSRWGMKPGDWYACLHMRDTAHYAELDGTGQSHRNANVQSYVKAIKYIVSKGGWVIKLGGPKSPKLPELDHVIDYARSEYRSGLMDIELIRNSRLFIGTTSGLTNVAISFGVPAALVNCITTDAQLWNNRVRFALKWMRLHDRTLINQNQITSTPWRWRMFSAEVLNQFDCKVANNSEDEILETVKEVEALAAGRHNEYLASFSEAKATLKAWEEGLAFSHFYGDAVPAIYWATKHQMLTSASSNRDA